MTGFQYLIFINGLNTKALSTHLDVSEELVVDWFNGDAVIESKHLDVISQITGIAPNLIEGKVSEIDRLRIMQKTLEQQRVLNPRVVDYDHQLTLFGQRAVFAEDAEIEAIDRRIAEIQRNQFEELFQVISDLDGAVETIVSLIDELSAEDRKDLYACLMDQEENR